MKEVFLRFAAFLLLFLFPLVYFAQCNISLSFTSKKVSCNGNCDGTITVTAAGGTAPLAYVWSTNPIQNVATAKNLCAGVYSVTVIDANGCSAVGFDTVKSPLLLQASIAVTNVNCNGKSTGKLIANPTGGTTLYTYSWSNAITTKINGTLAAGNYSLTVTDKNGCTVTSTATITQPDSALAVSTSITSATACGTPNGSASVSVKGGTIGNGFKYLWNNKDSTASISNVSAGSYIVSVTDGNGCLATTTAIITTTGSTLAIKTVVKTNPTLCGGGLNGSIKVTLTGSTAPYAYSWSNGATSSTTALTNTLTGVGVGTYTLTVTDKNGCVSGTISSLVAPTPISISTVSSKLTCYGSNTGSLAATVKGGTTPYTYGWSAIPVQTTSTATGLTAGNYTLTVTDKNGCTSIGVDSVVGPKQLMPNISSSFPKCFGNLNGSLLAAPTGGTSPYTYTWSTIPAQKTATISNIGSGLYKLTITDKNGCTQVDSVLLQQPSPILVSAIGGITGCNSSLGSISATNITGGTSPYSYSWNTGDTLSSLSNLAAGSYTVTVTDVNKCNASAVALVTNSSGLSLTTSITKGLVCFGDTNAIGLATASGGTQPYAYSWSLPIPQFTSQVNNLKAGSYSVTVVDSLGCAIRSSLLISNPLAISATFKKTAELCPGLQTGVDTVVAMNGAAPYNYNWSNGQNDSIATGLIGGTYTVTITDNNGCVSLLSSTIKQLAVTFNNINAICTLGSNGVADAIVKGGTVPYTYNWSTSPVQTTAVARGLSAGTYSVTVSDANGCSLIAIDSIILPSVHVVNLTNVSCYSGNNGSVSVSVLGGYSPYSYSWSTGIDSVSPLPSAALNKLLSGNYSVTVTDVHSCSTSISFSISQPTNGLAVQLNPSNILCNGASTGSLLGIAQGGTPPFNYAWSNDSIGLSDTLISNLLAGSYSLTVSDANGCSISTSAQIAQPLNALSANVMATNVLCFGSTTGSLLGYANGGTMPYNYSWSNNTSGITDTLVLGLSSGSYTLTVTDANGCSFSTISYISQPVSSLTVNKLTLSNGCPSCSTTSAVLNAIGGTSPYQYSWSTNPVQTSDTAINLSPSTIYNWTVTDANGCLVSDTLMLSPITTSIINADNSLNVFTASPNPNNGQFILHAQLAMPQDLTVRIYNTVGQLVYSDFKHQTLGFTQTIGLSNLAYGIYYVELKSASIMQNLRLVIQH